MPSRRALSFFFDVHSDFFEEIAKFRAARRIWAREIERRYHPRNPRSLLLRTHAQTAGVSLTAQQPYNNIVRVALQALAAVLGARNRCIRMRWTRRSPCQRQRRHGRPCVPSRLSRTRPGDGYD